MKRMFLFVIFVSLLTSCNNNREVKLTVLGENSSNLQAMEALKSTYEKKANIIIDFKPNTFEDAFNKANQDFSNKTGLYDIVLQYNFSLSSFVRNKYVYNLDELTQDIPPNAFAFEADLFSNAWKEVSFYYKNPDNPNDGIVKVGYPFASNTMLLVYNKKMFDDSNNQSSFHLKYNEKLMVPQNWEQFYKVSEFFTYTNEQTKQENFGICLQGAEGGWLYYEFCVFLYGMGGAIMDKERGWEGSENTPITLQSPEAIQATKYYKSLKPFNAGNYFTIDVTSQTKIMKQGNVAMGFVWSDYLYNFVYENEGNLDDRFGFAPIPGGKSPLAGGSFYINKQSKHPKEAAKYIIDLMQPANQIELAKKGLCSPLRTTYDNSEVQKIPYSNALKQSLERGVYMFEAGPESNLVSQVITNYIQQVWNNQLTAKEALARAQEDIEKGRSEIFSNL
mgnify:CR=1 FL=1